MTITSDIVRDFLYCRYKAYQKSRNHSGLLRSYTSIIAALKSIQLEKYHALIAQGDTAMGDRGVFNRPFRGSFNQVEKNCSFIAPGITLHFDAVEVTNTRTAIPVIVLPFEKVHRHEKVSMCIQAVLLQRHFRLKVPHCIIYFGKRLRAMKVRIAGNLLRTAAKAITELEKIIDRVEAPVFYMNDHCSGCEFKEGCHHKLLERDDLSLLAGFRPKEVLHLNGRGIFSVRQLSYTFSPKRHKYQKRKFLPALKALAIREKKTFITDIPELPASSTQIFLDVEGIPDRNFYYLIGATVRSNGVMTHHSFWANNEDEELSMFRELINLLKVHTAAVIYHYGTYERAALKKARAILTSTETAILDDVLNKASNVLDFLRANVYAPTYSNSLKDIGGLLGCTWDGPIASGFESMIWRYEWELYQRNNVKDALVQYNHQDCLALLRVTDWIRSVTENVSDDQRAENTAQRNLFKWGVTNYVVKELEEINQRAYFTYQRERILLRTETKVRLSIKRRNVQSNAFSKLTRKTNLFPRQCSVCGNTALKIIRSGQKVQTDLTFTSSGIRRNVTEYTGGAFHCKRCKKNYSTENMRRLSSYGDNLMIWAVNQKIQYGLSSEQVINVLKDSFAIAVSRTQMTMFKETIARRYAVAYRDILKEMLSSPTIHIDETVARIKGVDGYVWVFANHANVYYEFRDSRRTDFLKPLLESFKGVLISDFYSGYDSMECLQQKCLIHLIRDMNEDLLKNQFDTEVKEIVVGFGQLLRSIIATIDKYGLKKRHLKKHLKNVDQFYTLMLSSRSFESAVAESIAKRLQKYRDKIFVFLTQEGIAWNNNMAEHSIKPFAKWRRKISKSLIKANIDHHLMLLSLLQTCRYRSVNFFEFLKSRAITVSEFEAQINFTRNRRR